MNFKVATVNVKEFESTVKDICKKFKLEVSFSYGDKILLYVDREDESNPVDVFGYDVALIIPELEKMTNTGFSYLGCIKNEEAITIHPSVRATDKEFSLSSLKAEIENFPCVECGKKITRKIIHVFENDTTGEVTVYGSGCAVKKFGFDLTKLAHKFDFINTSINEGGFDRMGGRGYEVIDAIEWSRISYYLINEYGYVSGSKAQYDETVSSTKSETWGIYQALRSKGTSNWEREIKATMPAKLKDCGFDYEAFRAYVTNYVASLEDGDFSFNISAVANLLEDGLVSPRMSGFNAYIVFKYWYDVIRVAVEKITFNTDYTGMNDGDKIKNVKVQVLGHYSFEGRFGTTYIYTMKGVENNIKYKWFSGNIVEIGKEYIISSATIKELEDHEKYGKSVVITRARTKEV